MKIEIAAICDAAKEYGTRLNLLGALDLVRAPQVPFVIRHLDVVCRVRLEAAEEGNHDASVSLIDGDGERIMDDIHIGFGVGNAPGLASAAANVLLPLDTITIPQHGEYSLDISIDGVPKVSLPLHVVP